MTMPTMALIGIAAYPQNPLYCSQPQFFVTTVATAWLDGERGGASWVLSLCTCQASRRAPVVGQGRGGAGSFGWAL